MKVQLLSRSELVAQFADAMRSIVPGLSAADIIADGEIHRFTAEGDRRGSGAAWYSLHADGRPAGAFGSWKTGEQGTWTANGDALSPAERAAFREQAERAQAQRKAQDKARRKQAAQIAADAWASARSGSVRHDYLAAKGIQACGARIGDFPLIDRETGQVTRTIKGALLLMVRDLDRNVHSIQGVVEQRAPDGSTRFQKLFLSGGAKKGHFHAIGQPRRDDAGRRVFLLAEGFATGASIHEATGHSVVVAFDSGNLEPVAKVIRAKFPDAVILVCGDDDVRTDGNPGRTKATAAAAAVGGVAVFPELTQADVADGLSDFNDAHQRHGPEAVAACIDAALRPAPEAEPEQGDDASRRDVPATTRVAQAAKASMRLRQLMIGYGQVDGAPIAMGRAGDLCGFYTAAGDVILLRDGRLFADPGILRLQSLDWWTGYCMGDSNKGKYDAQMIGNALLETTHRAGSLDAGNIPAEIEAADEVQRKLAVALLHSDPSAHVLSSVLIGDPEWSGIIWWNEFASRVEARKPPPCGGAAGPWTDRQDKMLSAWVTATYGVSVSRSMVAEAVELLAMTDQRHPVRDYLQSVAWDVTPRLDTWLTRFAGVKNDVYTRNVGAKTLIGAVARIMSPGAKFDTMLVIEGDQGLKKSSLIAALAPCREWFSSSLKGDLESKDVAIGLSGKWIVELAEMAVVGKASTEVTKSFLSEQVDNYRAPYGVRAEDHPRQCAFFATTNPEGDKTYLRDTTGGRRFWPVEATCIDLDALSECRDQLWAEAVHRYKQGEQWWLTEEVEILAKAEQAERLSGNVWEEHLARFLSMQRHPMTGEWTKRRGAPVDGFFASEVFAAIAGRPMMRKDAGDSRAIANAARSLGWIQEASKTRRWVPASTMSIARAALCAPAIRHDGHANGIFGAGDTETDNLRGDLLQACAHRRN